MTARLIIVPGAMPSRDANGRALAAKFRFYLPTTSTPTTVYTTSALTVAHAWPIVSDDAGRWPQIWADEQTYFDVAWSDLATDSLIASYSNIRALSDAAAASADIATDAALQAQEAADDAAATLVLIAAEIKDLGDFSAAVTASQAAAATATTKASEAAASAVASAASASSIDQNIIFGRAIAAASLL